MSFFDKLRKLYTERRERLMAEHRRGVSFGDVFTDRWERARFHGFGEGSSCYDNVLILGDVTVGKHTWIGPNVVLDGSGGLTIGDYCSISSGVHIYTHNTVRWSVSLGKEPPERKPTAIGSGVYIGPQAVIQMGVTVGDRAVIGALSLVNRDVPAGSRVWGIPARAAPDPQAEARS